jgi:hypothetical protein
MTTQPPIHHRVGTAMVGFLTMVWNYMLSWGQSTPTTEARNPTTTPTRNTPYPNQPFSPQSPTRPTRPSPPTTSYTPPKPPPTELPPTP